MKCPKCAYVRQITDAGPSYECPNCGIVYAKYKPISRPPSPVPVSSQHAAAPQSVPPIMSSAGALPANTAVCKNCELVGQVQVQVPGNKWVELALYFFWIAPGVIYSIWRRNNKRQVCGACGSDQLVAASTPAGRRILEGGASHQPISAVSLQGTTVQPPTFGKLTAVVAGFLSLNVLVVCVALIVLMFSREGGGRVGSILVFLIPACALGLWLASVARRTWSAKSREVLQPIVGRGLVGH